MSHSIHWWATHVCVFYSTFKFCLSTFTLKHRIPAETNQQASTCSISSVVLVWQIPKPGEWKQIKLILYYFTQLCNAHGKILYRCIVCHSILLYTQSMMMNISSHFRMTYSPPLQNLPPPSSLHPHLGCRGAQVDETSSTNPHHLNPPTQACTSQPRHPKITAKSPDTLLPHPHYNTNEDIPGTHLKTTRPSKRKIPQYLPRKNT